MTAVLYFCVLAAFLPFSCEIFKLKVRNARMIPISVLYFVDGNHVTQSGNAKARTEIRKAIFADYDKVNIPDKPNVKFALTLTNIDVVGV